MSDVPSSGSGQCRVCRGLALYEPVPNGPWWTHDDPSADHRVVIDPDTTSFGPHGVRPPGVTPKYAMGGIITAPAAESMSAALRRAEQERDEAAAQRDIACALVVENLRTEQDRDLARAELASARQELDAVRTARDNLDRQLALAHREVLELDAQIKLCPRCGVQLAAEVAAERGEATE